MFLLCLLALSLLNLISTHSSCCLSLPSSHANIPLSWIWLSYFCPSKGHFIPQRSFYFFLLESDKLSNISRNESLNKSIFLCFKYSFWLHATLSCHLSKNNERPRSLVCKLYEFLKFLRAVFHALDSKLSLQVGPVPATGGTDTKQTYPKWLCYFSFKEPLGILLVWGERWSRIPIKYTSLKTRDYPRMAEERSKLAKGSVDETDGSKHTLQCTE